MKSFERVINPKLVKAMDEFNLEKTPETQMNFINELNEASLLIPVNVKEMPNENAPDSEISLQVKLMSDEDGALYYGAFTDWDELSKFEDLRDDAVVLTYKEIRELLTLDSEKNLGIIINPLKYEIDFILTEDVMQEIDKQLK